jgi:hypothetical protein
MTDDVIVARISYGSPECCGPRPVDLDQCRDALDTPLCEDLLYMPHELSGNALAPVPGIHH